MQPCPLRARRPRPLRPSFSILGALALAVGLAPMGSDTALAAEPRLLADLQTSPVGSRPLGFVDFGGAVVFDAFTPEYGRELWITDGTSEGTRLFVDANPGPSDSYFSSDSISRPTEVIGDRLFFAVSVEGTEPKLWVSDPSGQQAGPILDRLWVFAGTWNDRLLVIRNGADQISELWITDGTSEGTRSLLRFDGVEVPSLPDAFGVLGNRLFMAAERVDLGREWWTLDLSAALAGPTDPTLLLDILPGPGNGLDFTSHPTVLGDRLYFEAANGAFGAELWSSDGTAEGTRIVADLEPGVDSSSPFSLVAAAGRLYFQTLIEDAGTRIVLWSTDGTAAGTNRIVDREVGQAYISPSRVAELDGRLLFGVYDDAHGLELWSSDGTREGTRLLVDLWPGEQGSSPLVQSVLKRPGEPDLVFFLATTAGVGGEPWVTDGTPEGTRLLANIGPGGFSSSSYGEAAGGHIFFKANDSVIGSELWISDGTPEGTRLLADLDTASTRSSYADNLHSLGDRAYFDGSSLPGTDSYFRIWTTDGTADGTVQVEPTDSTMGPALHDAGEIFAGAFWFIGQTDSTGREVFRLEGEGPPVPFDLVPGPVGSEPLRLLATDSVLYALTIRGQQPRLWAIDLEGSISDLGPLAPAGETVRSQTQGENRLFAWPGGAHGDRVAAFVTTSEDTGTGAPDEMRRLWVSDGTPSNTEQLAVLERVIQGISPEAAGMRGLLLFRGHDAARGSEPWVSDGTASGTKPLLELAPGVSSSSPSGFVTTRWHAFFTAWEGPGTCRGLWRTDGREFGTVKVHDGCVLGVPMSARGSIFFAAEDAFLGTELWVLEPGAVAARPVIDLEAGPGSSSPYVLGEVGGRLYFSATVSGQGRELYSTDGTATGTRFEGEMAPGSDSSDPVEPTLVGGNLLFTADDGIHGRELWITDLECSASPSSLCLDDGRFQVASRWHFGDGVAHGGVVTEGSSYTLPLTADTGGFWYFDPENVESALKVLDGTSINGHFWFFMASLSNVGFDIEVFDTETGASRAYRNPFGTFASFGDVLALPAEGASATSPAAGPTMMHPEDAAGVALPLVFEVPAARSAAAKAEPCLPSDEVLCVDDEPGDGRFRLTATWRDFEDGTGPGFARELTDDTGGFWFFDDANVELLVKVLDARDLNGYFWVFLGSLSNVEFTLTVEDTETGGQAIYTNPLGTFASFGDVEALQGL